MNHNLYEFGCEPISDGECALRTARHLQGEVRLPAVLDGLKVAVIDPAGFRYDGPTSLILPEGTLILFDHAFVNDEELAAVTLPDSLDRIGVNPFLNSGVRDIRLNPGHPRFAFRDGCLIDKAERTLIAVLENQAGREIILPEGIDVIGESALAFFDDPHNVYIPDGVAEIDHLAFNEFWQLGRLSLPDTLRTIGSYAFQRCWQMHDMNLRLPEGLQSIGACAFNDCPKLHSVTVPATVTQIGRQAFQCADDFVLRVYAGSYAERYARENDVPIVIIG